MPDEAPIETAVRGWIRFSDHGIVLEYRTRSSATRIRLDTLSYMVLMDDNLRAIKMGKDAEKHFDGLSGALKDKMLLFKDIYWQLFDGTDESTEFEATDGRTLEKSTVIAAAFNYVQD